MDRDTIAENWKVTSEGSTAPIENGSTRQLQWLLHIEVSWWMGICSHMKSSDAECRESSQVLAQCLYNTMQCLYNVMQWLHRGQDLAQYCDSKGARHGRTCGACGACGAWIKESQRVSFELCGGGRIFVWRRKNLATWLIYYSGCNPLAHNGLSDTQRSGEQILWNLVYLVHAAVSITAQNKKKPRK